MDIANNVFLVSGGASGLGAATVRMLAGAGARVVVADVQGQAGAALAAQFAGTVHFVCCDITSPAECAAAVERAVGLGPLRGLVNCAGIVAGEKTVGRDGPHPIASFEHVIAVNLVGTFNLLRLAAAAMCALAPAADGERGVIINTSSVAAFDGQIGQAAYAASKGGVAAMTLPIARDLARSGVRCVTIAPGLFETPMMAGLPAEVRASLGSQVPFPPRLGRPEEFAHLVQAIFGNLLINGEVIRLDGALRMPPR